MRVQRSDKGEKAILGIGNSVLKVKEERTARILVVGERVGETQVGAGLRVKPKSLAVFSVGDGSHQGLSTGLVGGITLVFCDEHFGGLGAGDHEDALGDKILSTSKVILIQI